MVKIKFVLIALLLITVGILPVLSGCAGGGGAPCSNYTILIGGSFPLAGGPYPEDGEAVLDAFQDYAKWVNDNHKISPWSSDTFPSNITLVVVSMNDMASPTTAATCYATLKAAGLKVFRISGSGIGSAMKATLFSDQCGATSMASGAWVLTGGSGSIFTTYPLYTEQMAAVADWFITGNATINPNGWNVTHGGGNYTKPRVAYLTNNSFGSTGSLIVASLNNYLTSIGYNLVDTNPHFVTSGPAASYDPALALASLQWCQNNTIDLTLGAMVASPAESMMNLANSLGIGAAGSGHNGNWTMQIALSSPAHPVMIQRDAIYTWLNPNLADGLVVAGSYPSWNDIALGVNFSKTLQNTYRPGQGVTYNATAYALSHVMYQHGVIEAMVQVDAIRRAMVNTGKSPCDLTMSDIFTQGFLKINGLSTGGIIPGIIDYSTGKVEGAQYVRVDQCWNGTVILLGDTFPIRPNLW